jgi:hypothetical protein
METTSDTIHLQSEDESLKQSFRLKGENGFQV